MKVHTHSDAATTARALITEQLLPRLRAGVCAVAVSGGSTPKLLFEMMASPAFREQIPWGNLRLYWVDERCVPPTDQQSNYGMTAAALSLPSTPLLPEHIFRIQGENQPEAEALRYTELVRQQLPCTSEDCPIFDLVLLGIGDDGHTSSIFPHQMQLLQEPTPYVVAQHPSGQQRICLTGPTILKAKTVVFHAVGEGKRHILQQIKEAHPAAEAYPSNYFVQQRSDLLLYTDQPLS